MPEGMLLPPVAAKAANLAAAAAPSSAAADPAAEESAASFGEVLNAQLSRPPAAGEAAEPAGEPAAAVAPEGTGQDLASLLAALEGAVTGLPAGVPATAVAATTAGVIPGTVSGAPVSSEGADPRADPLLPGPAARGTVLRVASDAAAQSTRGPVFALPDKAEVPIPHARDAAVAGPAPGLLHAADSKPVIAEARAAELPLQAAAAHAKPAEVAPLPVSRLQDTPKISATVSVPVGNAAWGEAVADRVTWVMHSRQPVAELQLNPPNLGPLEVRVALNGDQATVSFFSAHAPVREALQAAAPRLAEAFSATGVTLGDVFVGADAQSHREPAEPGARGTARRSAETDSRAVPGPYPAVWTSAAGAMRAVDLFA